jgi:CheY-like chemotaxis protein
MAVLARGLVVDDEVDLAENTRELMDVAFLELSLPVEWHNAHSVPEAIRAVRDEPPFDFAIVDFSMERGNTGLRVVKELRRRHRSDCYILVVTGYPQDNVDFIGESLRADANAALLRGQLILSSRDGDDAWNAYGVARRIRKHLIALDRGPGGFTIDFDEGVGIQSMLYSLGDPPGDYPHAAARGEHIARNLILDCLGRDEDDASTNLKVEYLAPGRSGAHVCKVVRSQQGHADQSFVLKIGLDHAALRAERLANALAAKSLSPQVLVQLSGEMRTHEASGYAALEAGLARDSVTLAAWLSDPATEVAHARTVAEELFGVHLKVLFQANLRQERPVEDWLTLSPVLKLRVREALARYAGIWAHADGAGRRDVVDLTRDLHAFIDEGTLPGIDPRLRGGRVTQVHAFGDLHSTNVMVYTAAHPRPLLVDASQYGSHHWATDATRLVVDLVVQVRRLGVESMRWPAVGEDIAYAEGLCGDGGDAATPVDAFIKAVVGRRHAYLHLDEVAPRKSDWHWQWHVALAKEFLRQGSRSGMLPTRAVVALTAAAGHLARAAEAFKH